MNEKLQGCTDKEVSKRPRFKIIIFIYVTGDSNDKANFKIVLITLDLQSENG